MSRTEIFPTVFATSIGQQFNILPKTKPKMTSKDHELLRTRTDMMVCFQEMAMACPLEDCMIAFHGVKLTEIQSQKLNLIHRSTRPWILGNNTATLLSKLQSPTISGRDAKDITAAIVEHLQERDTSGNDGKKKTSGFTVYMASTDSPE